MEAPCHKGLELKEVFKAPATCDACKQPMPNVVDHLTCGSCGANYSVDGSAYVSDEVKLAEARALADEIAKEDAEKAEKENALDAPPVDAPFDSPEHAPESTPVDTFAHDVPPAKKDVPPAGKKGK